MKTEPTETATRGWLRGRAKRVLGGSLLLVSLGALGVFVAIRYSEHEPHWQGRSLSSWLVDLDFSKPAPVRAEARLAVQQIGTNALPALGRWIAAKEEGKAGGIGERIAGRLWVWSRGRWNLLPPDRRQLAARGYETLGNLAQPAIPELVSLLQLKASCGQAASALAGIGSPSVGPLISCLSSDDWEAQRLAITALGAIAAQPERCVPALLGQVGRPNQSDALLSLGEFREAAIVALPQLESALTSTGSACFNAAYALAQLGEAGLQPLLRGLLSTNPYVRKACAMGLAWHETLPKVRDSAGESRLGSFCGRISLFHSLSFDMTMRLFTDGEAATFLSLVAPYVQSSNSKVYEAAAAVTNRLAQLPPQENRPVTQSHLPGGATDE